MPRYSIITPTILRPTLKRLCDSIDMQTDEDWEHIIQVDKPINLVTGPERSLISEIQAMSVAPAGRRKFFFCDKNHKCVGNYCRGIAFKKATGDYILHIDDDDYYADDKVFETLREVTATWAIWPTLSYGKRCHHDPPGIHKTGSAMFMYRRDTGLTFKAIPDYSADGQLVEELKARYPYQALDIRPLVIYEQANHGMTQAEIEQAKLPKPQKLIYESDGLTLDWNLNYKKKV